MMGGTAIPPDSLDDDSLDPGNNNKINKIITVDDAESLQPQDLIGMK